MAVGDKVYVANRIGSIRGFNSHHVSVVWDDVTPVTTYTLDPIGFVDLTAAFADTCVSGKHARLRDAVAYQEARVATRDERIAALTDQCENAVSGVVQANKLLSELEHIIPAVPGGLADAARKLVEREEVLTSQRNNARRALKNAFESIEKYRTCLRVGLKMGDGVDLPSDLALRDGFVNFINRHRRLQSTYEDMARERKRFEDELASMTERCHKVMQINQDASDLVNPIVGEVGSLVDEVCELVNRYERMLQTVQYGVGAMTPDPVHDPMPEIFVDVDGSPLSPGEARDIPAFVFDTVQRDEIHRLVHDHIKHLYIETDGSGYSHIRWPDAAS
jgi:hypothetical protein